MLNAEHASPGATCGCAPPPCGNEQTCVGSGLAGTATSAGALSPQQQAGHVARAQQTFSVSPRTGLNTPGRTAGEGRHRPSLRSGESLLVPDKGNTARGTQPSVAGPADTGLLSSVPSGSFAEQLSCCPVPSPLRALRGAVSSPSHTVQRKQSESALCPLHAGTVPQACPWEDRAGQLPVTRYDGDNGRLSAVLGWGGELVTECVILMRRGMK